MIFQPGFYTQPFSSNPPLNFNKKLWHGKKRTILNTPLNKWKHSKGTRGHDYFLTSKLCWIWSREIILSWSTWFLAKVRAVAFLMRKQLLELLHQLFTSGLMTPQCYVSSVLELFAVCHSICSCRGHPCISMKGNIYLDFCQGCIMFCLFILALLCSFMVIISHPQWLLLSGSL